MLTTFLQEIRATGKALIRIPGRETPSATLERVEREAETEPEIGRLLREWHSGEMEDLGGEALPFDEQAARLGACLLFRAAWGYLNRDLKAGETSRLLSVKTHWEAAASAQFSVDLTLRHLPAVYRMAENLAPGDPLLRAMRELSWRWPLSGAGMQAATPGTTRPDGEPEGRDIRGREEAVEGGDGNGLPLRDPAHPAAFEALRGHAGLWGLFLDRIVERRAQYWMADRTVAGGVRRRLGAYIKDLAPGMDVPSVQSVPTPPP